MPAKPVVAAGTSLCGVVLMCMFVGLDLLFFGIVPLNSIVLTILPIVGLVAGFLVSRTRS